MIIPWYTLGLFDIAMQVFKILGYIWIHNSKIYGNVKLPGGNQLGKTKVLYKLGSILIWIFFGFVYTQGIATYYNLSMNWTWWSNCWFWGTWLADKLNGFIFAYNANYFANLILTWETLRNICHWDIAWYNPLGYVDGTLDDEDEDRSILIYLNIPQLAV